jgi:hypothetical protein
MARPLHIELAGVLCHVRSRGDRHADIYLVDTGQWTWLALLGGV